jgi:hypothetical protein
VSTNRLKPFLDKTNSLGNISCAVVKQIFNDGQRRGYWLGYEQAMKDEHERRQAMYAAGVFHMLGVVFATVAVILLLKNL